MARQAGPLFITGTIDNMVFYKLGDHYYMRRKGEPTPITKKRMRQKEHYPVLCMRKQEFGRASELVRSVYYTHLPKAVRKHGLFGKLTGKAVRWLRAGKTEKEIQQLVIQAALPAKENSLPLPASTTPVHKTKRDFTPVGQCTDRTIDAQKPSKIPVSSLFTVGTTLYKNNYLASYAYKQKRPEPSSSLTITADHT